ncbi:MAG: NAD(P)-dependent oxidoreductase [Candidatus Latescibacteria bacterium]|nr:NAD(P)-dependent oxidoreductase [Candidatus Latescibacterota bacterium]MDP7447336.1 NAD(P)-dependent oxidoreductase [Candidatus Latescibacterota bacterium]HJP30839.1 NAD(P)-dependent oxidoreductase [Candidatus Latescibacterota bacterium]
MRILVTGITGRIGANLAAQLIHQGHTVRGLVWGRDRRTEKLDGLGVELLEGTLTERADVDAAVSGMEAVYHLGAAFQGGGPFTEDDYFEINLRGTFHVLEACRQEGIAHLLFASSDALYDKYVPGGMAEPITEKLPRQPRGWYAMSKAAGEQLCEGYGRSFGLPVTILRFAMVLGAGEILDFPQFYLGHMRQGRPALEALWEGEERLVLLQDDAGRPFKKHVADVRDIVHGCLCALGKERAFGQIYQLAGPAAFTWDEAIYRLTELLQIPFVEARPGGVPTYYEFDLDKARGDLGFRPEYDVVRMMVDALNHRRGEPTGVLTTL